MIHIDPKSIENSFNAVSMFPERRARVEIQCFEQGLQRLMARFEAINAMPGAVPIPPEVLAESEQRYASAMRAVWASESRCASWFVVGPANFPVERNRKRMASVDLRRTEAARVLNNSLKHFEHLAFPHGMPGSAVRSDDPDAIEKLEENLAERERRQEMMRAVNKVVRAFYHKGVRDSDSGPKWLHYVAALRDIIVGCSEGLALKLMKGDEIGRRGFADYSLSNNNAEIHRLEGRLKVLKSRAAREPEAPVLHNSGAQIVERLDLHRVQILFPGKPPEQIRAKLKGYGFRWAPSEGAWQAHLSNSAKWKASQIVQAFGEQQQKEQA